ncbi:OmpA family protein [Luteimonas sp. RD2P54]|uniref:OmpA family protein n=1 Tax=Luteimonas endophytica TaxID=3042023 RepID=A0ABT6JAY2_9GAMM|nr:OmpA family protein [Luteimonas endophytica]MDH5823745.1 OmpA family protein [Luteimonas endophytica]
MQRLVVFLALALCAGTLPAQDAAAPVIAEGVVPDQATKSMILEKLRELYGTERVVDRVQVESIPAPPNWGSYVANMIGPGLQRVSEGKLEVNGQSVRISGEVVNEAQRQQVASELSLASNSTYTVTNGLGTGGSGQGLLDATLGDRIIEFESGSARLTDLGRYILDEMAEKLQEIGEARVQIVGHTDDVGQRQANLALSQARAEAVRAYLVEQGIPRDNLSVLGKGPDEPIADNATDEGRARNRRIQFRVL